MACIIQLSDDLDTVIIRDTSRPGWVEIRGGAGYATGDPCSPDFRAFMDSLSAPTVAQLFSGDVACINPNNPRTCGDIAVVMNALD